MSLQDNGTKMNVLSNDKKKEKKNDQQSQNGITVHNILTSLVFLISSGG